MSPCSLSLIFLSLPPTPLVFGTATWHLAWIASLVSQALWLSGGSFWLPHNAHCDTTFVCVRCVAFLEVMWFLNFEKISDLLPTTSTQHKEFNKIDCHRLDFPTLQFPSASIVPYPLFLCPHSPLSFSLLSLQSFVLYPFVLLSLCLLFYCLPVLCPSPFIRKNGIW